MPEFMKRYWNLHSNVLTSRSAPEAPQHHFNLTDLLRCEKFNLVGEEVGKTTFRTRKKDDSLSDVNKSRFIDLKDCKHFQFIMFLVDFFFFFCTSIIRQMLPASNYIVFISFSSSQNRF